MGKQKFSRGLKRSICIEYMQSGKSRKEIALKYNLPSTYKFAVQLDTFLPKSFGNSRKMCIFAP